MWSKSSKILSSSSGKNKLENLTKLEFTTVNISVVIEYTQVQEIVLSNTTYV